MGGGSVLNALIHQAVKAGRVSEDMRAEFEATAKAMLADGATGFGEMSILHLSMSANHAFEEAPADHELFLLLADIAAQNDAPIDIHMDPVLDDMQTPNPLLERSAQNPAALQGNIEPFEALLAHNADARIVWAHTDDTTGDLSAELLREMLGRHPNLYLSLRLSLPRGPASSRRDNVLDDSGNIRQEWLDLIEDYADRFGIGSDTFWGGGEAGPSQTLVASFLAQLPGDVAQMVACRNVVAIYKLDVACP
jgi:CRP-like cAMP-binding protein